MVGRWLISLHICLVLVTFFPSPVFALRSIQVRSYKLHDAQEFVGNPGLQNIYFHKSFNLEYTKGDVYLSSTPDGNGPISFDHYLYINSSYPSSGDFRFTSNCGPHTLPALNITQFMSKGHSSDTLNFIVRYSRGSFCSHSKKYDGVNKNYANVGDLYIVYFEELDNAPEPFLELPWDYASAGLNFYEASVLINSYFDHEYPFLSVWELEEPEETKDNMIIYESAIPTDEKVYSSHDGYDWGGRAGAYNGEPQLAAAAGTATYVHSCSACGNAIHIDHHNGYQTRYYHLQDKELVTTSSVEVVQGQKIGLIGSTGNSDGPHIHFMVVYDKDGDGDFNDNIPDGLVDPFGWQSYDPDPWEEHTFTQNGEQKSGSRSYYLWKNLPLGISAALPYDVDSKKNIYRYQINIPKNTFDVDQILEAHLQDRIEQENLKSVDNSISVKVHDGYHNLVTNFKKAWSLILNFKPQRIDRYDTSTLAIYSRSEGEEQWKKENTTIDFQKNTASISIQHMTDFALMGELLDDVPPVTTASLSGILAETGNVATIESEIFMTQEEATNSAPLFTSPVTVHLLPKDTPVEDSLGIDYTLYKINNSEWLNYENTFELNEENEYIIAFYSADGDGNEEKAKYISFKIDFDPVTPTPTSTQTPTPSLISPTPSESLESLIVEDPTPTSTPTNTPTPLPTTAQSSSITQSYQSPTHTPMPTIENFGQVLAAQTSSIPTPISTFENQNGEKDTSFTEVPSSEVNPKENSVLGANTIETKKDDNWWKYILGIVASMTTAGGSYLWKQRKNIVFWLYGNK